MATTSVRLVKYVKDGSAWKYVKVERYLNGKIKPDPRKGTYYLDWLEGNKRRRQAVGSDPQEALNALKRKEHSFEAVAIGVPVVPGPEGKRLLRVCAKEFLEFVKEHRSHKTYNASSNAVTDFLASCKKDFIEDITRDDLLEFKTHLRKDKRMLSDRTIANKWERLINFLTFYKIEVHGKGPGGDAPRYVEEEVEIYEQEDLRQFFEFCDDEQKILFEFFLYSGMRDQEVAHVYIENVRFAQNVLQVRKKPDWRPKALKERDIPINSKLVEPLKAWIEKRKAARDGSPLLFPAKEGGVQQHFEREVTDVVEHAAVDGSPLSTYFHLHKFRATFATNCIRNGADIPTVQKWMGHSDIKSTMRYIKPAGGAEAQKLMAGITFGL